MCTQVVWVEQEGQHFANDAGKGELGGVGVDSVFHTYVYAQVDTVHELMEKLDDRGDIALGL